jgi:hypothetical protein
MEQVQENKGNSQQSRRKFRQCAVLGAGAEASQGEGVITLQRTTQRPRTMALSAVSPVLTGTCWESCPGTSSTGKKGDRCTSGFISFIKEKIAPNQKQ